MKKIWKDFYNENPECILKDANMPRKLLQHAKMNQDWIYNDQYDWFRNKFGPVWIPLNHNDFFDDFIEIILCGDHLCNVAPLDRKIPKIDLLEILSLFDDLLSNYAGYRRVPCRVNGIIKLAE